MPCMDFFHEAGGGCYKGENFHEAGEGIAGGGENFLEAGGSLLKKRECTLKIDGEIGKVEMHVKN